MFLFASEEEAINVLTSVNQSTVNRDGQEICFINHAETKVEPSHALRKLCANVAQLTIMYHSPGVGVPFKLIVCHV